MLKLVRIFIVLGSISLCIGQSLMAEDTPAGMPELSFGVVADAQYCDCEPHGTRYYRESVHKLEEAILDFNAADLDFVIQLGDLIDRDAASFETVLPIYRKSETPVYHVPGNHDFVGVPKRLYLDILDLERGFYDFSCQSWRFIVLDGNDLSFYATPKDSEKFAEVETLFAQVSDEGRLNAHKWNGGISQKQFDWLKKTLKKAEAQGENVILFSHFPVFPPDMHNLWNDAELLEVFDSSSHITAYFCGHNHAGNYAERNGVHYLNLRGMVETQDTNAYAIIDVYDEYLSVSGIGREPDRILD